ncbi:Leucine Rich Repeat domain protein [Aspergillus clavatus NRRL 1]|uniref:F-box domain protein n=1 Tax=Aspergillus clavatus (strain ATCC 1007 / CBS 513.65 / DSM 816 / NCTC 3887 / NRRL 1 / QM 1276 / 107) TaxID=344612 RepID=A1CG38_ASPCL|nr:F-box domain protein [Aspergillus clavatus NRRL 1]EAW10918.1 F-box domain protein [Aspergillus clavatus NRRL 1]
MGVSRDRGRDEAAALTQQKGQKLYQQGHFQAALEAFTETLNSGHADIIGVYDNRAATFAKLAKYDLALRDARAMIKTDKQDARGYLRCAKVLLSDGKPDKALEVYAYALKTLSKGNPRRQLLEQLHDKLWSKVYAKCHDPFSVLPLEVAMMVLHQFSFKQIVAILRVSKKWDQFLSSMRDLWMRIDLSDARGKVQWHSVRAYIRRSKAMLTHAVMRNVATPSTGKVLEFFSRCPNLEHFELWALAKPETLYDLFKGSRRLKTLIVSGHTAVPQEVVGKFLQSLPLLERLEIHDAKPSPAVRVQWPETLPHLRSITLGATVSSSSPEVQISALHFPIQQPSSAFPQLEELRLNWSPRIFTSYRLGINLEDFARLRRLDLGGIYVGAEFGLPSDLEYLRIRGGTGLVGGALVHREFPFAYEEPFELSSLHTLILSDVPWATSYTVQHFCTVAKAPLKTLHLDSCFRINGAQIADLVRMDSMKELQEFNVAHIAGIDDKVAVVMVQELVSLKALDLSYTRISGCTIKAFADARASDGKVAKVERIFAKCCDEVSSDAIAYGRARGIEIIT